jgi:hypothetical protein
MDLRTGRWNGYKYYHKTMVTVGDCDPAYPAMRYIADRLELNIEQRFWLAWLYACSYCSPTAYYMINEFPDFENVDTRRLQSWWDNNKQKCLFQTDRLRVKTQNQIVKMFKSYRGLIKGSQKQWFQSFILNSPGESYNKLYSYFSENLYYFGRFSLFLYLESIHELTGLCIHPTGLDLKNALSCTNGICYACGKDNWVNDSGFTKEQYKYLSIKLKKLYEELKIESSHIGIPCTYWNIETSLCAYKKLFWKKRYLGYYIDRQQEEIIKLQHAVKEGVDWSILWDFRKEYFHRSFLGEFNGWTGIRPKQEHIFMKTGKLTEQDIPVIEYKKSIDFGDVYSVYHA